MNYRLIGTIGILVVTVLMYFYNKYEQSWERRDSETLQDFFKENGL